MNKVNGTGKLPAYNVQVSVDIKTQLIVANETVLDTNDFNQLARQHQNVESNFGSDPDRCYTYDAGYHNLEQFEYVHTNQLDAFVASPRKENKPQKPSDEKEAFPEGMALPLCGFPKSKMSFPEGMSEWTPSEDSHKK